jgi:superfamily II DNA/RNA helicase
VCCGHTSIMAPNDGDKRDPRAWDALTPPLAEWILDAISSMGFARMTPVQASTILLFMGNKDVVVEVCAPTDVVHGQLLNFLLSGSYR